MADIRDIMKRFDEIGKSMPKQANLVVFPGRVGGQMIDNVKYAFLYFARHVPEIDGRFLTFDRDEHVLLQEQGLPSVLFGRDDSIEVLARAALIISDDFWWKNESPVYPLMQRARTVQIWHGVPLKAIGFPEIKSSSNMTPERAEYLKRGYSGYDAVISTSPFCTEQAFSRAFAAHDFPTLGYPRNDVMFREPTRDDLFNVDVELYAELKRFRKKGGKTIFYMPTFRDEGYDPFHCGAIDLAALSHVAEANNAYVVLKLHPYVNLNFKNLPPAIRVASSQSDIYPLMGQCDVLLTDYSSIYFDFLLLDRPIIFYPFDFDRYITKNRALLFDYDSMTPGKKVSTFQDLLRSIEETLADATDFSEERQQLCRKIFTHVDGKSAQRLNEYVQSHFNMKEIVS
ncbi:CDP-glycerol glycerophosphotransferase family protein [Desulfovibrio inopinatus]|uniref:CDP-glycerol glycerophosphotransferase family protein n=1 Tax=Desulfovibrio inopinatus TaxID=102109 RepID=UPI000419E9D6|nr:CDP-glycerol glycerophosphotransferase family protein [Desulfovibrio inopinatus]